MESRLGINYTFAIGYVMSRFYRESDRAPRALKQRQIKKTGYSMASFEEQKVGGGIRPPPTSLCDRHIVML